MKRKDIRGFTLKIGKYSLEYVSVYHLPSVIAISKGIKTIWRLERG